MNSYLAYNLASGMEAPEGPPVLLGTQVELDADVLRSVALIDLSQVDPSALEMTGRLSLVRRLLKVPGFQHRKIAIAIEGKPIARDRTLVISEPMISIGEIQLTTDEAIQWLGLSRDILLERINRDWGGLPMDLEEVSIIPHGDGNVLKLTGSPIAW